MFHLTLPLKIVTKGEMLILEHVEHLEAYMNYIKTSRKESEQKIIAETLHRQNHSPAG